MSRIAAAKVVLTVFLIGAAIVLMVAALLPPRTLKVSGVAPDPLTQRGSLHVHTRRSDGTAHCV